MNRADIYAITKKVEEQYQMAGLAAPEEHMCLYADFAVDVAVRAIQLKLNELANELQQMPLNDTANSIAIWIREGGNA